jgi:hypothetical protein
MYKCFIKIIAGLGLLLIGQPVHPQSKIEDSVEYHFKILDSLAQASKSDTIYSAKLVQSIEFMERRTKISASTDGTYYGRLGFTRNDLFKWHKWFTIHRTKK